MKKRCLLTALVLWVGMLLLGCEEFSPLPATQPTAPTTETEPSASSSVVVDENVFYFCNQLEFNRLYSQRLDGTDLKLVSDEYCYDVKQVGDTVYYISTDGLAAYHIPTGLRSLIAQAAQSYQIDGNHLVYSIDSEEYYSVELICRDLISGHEQAIATIEMGEFALGDGYVYYCAYDSSGGISLQAYDIENRERIALSVPGEYAYCYSLFAGQGGVYCQAYSDGEEHWIFTSPGNESVSVLDDLLPAFSQLIHADERGFLYIDYGYSNDEFSSIHHITPAGEDKLIVQADEEVSFMLTSLNNGQWLLTETRYVGWGELTEYGYYTHTSTQMQYQLMNSNFELTALDVTGELGSMFKDGDFPILDSSTARIPVNSDLYDLFVMRYGYEGAQPVCSTTHGAWLNIADRKVDLAFLAAPTEEELAYLQSKDVEIEMKLYGGDGLVFIGNAANPVWNLTHEQILAIYRGEITNWKQVGGPDRPIIVYYRDDQSGSQRLFESLVFKGQNIPDFETLGFPVMDSMSSIVNTILNDPYAIGYSIMTYLDEVYAEEELKVFSVNGAIPSPKTIKNQSYPYHTKGYLVIRSDEPEDSPARRLFNWFGCSVSNELLINCSVSPLHEDSQ